MFQQQQNVINNTAKKPPPPSRREKDKKRERKSESSHDGGESKENQEAQPAPLGELPKDRELKLGQDVKSAALRKRGGESKAAPAPSPVRLSPEASWLNPASPNH